MNLEKLKSEIQSFIGELVESANAHDVERHLSAYARTGETTMVFNGESFVGWDAIRARQRESWKDGNAGVIYGLDSPTQFQIISDELALATMVLRSRRPRPDGAMEERRLSYSSLWQRRSEGWRVIFAHESIIQ